MSTLDKDDRKRLVEGRKIDGKENTTVRGTTKEDKKIVAHNNIVTMIRQMRDLSNCVDAVASVMETPELSTRLKNKVTRELSSVSSVLANMATTMEGHARVLSPIPCISYAQEWLRAEDDRRKRLKCDQEGIQYEGDIRSTAQAIRHI